MLAGFPSMGIQARLFAHVASFGRVVSSRFEVLVVIAIHKAETLYQ